MLLRNVAALLGQATGLPDQPIYVRLTIYDEPVICLFLGVEPPDPPGPRRGRWVSVKLKTSVGSHIALPFNLDDMVEIVFP